MAEPDTTIRAASGGIEIDVVVVPRASRSRIVGRLGERLKVQVTAPPVDGAANAELASVLATALDVPKGAVEVARGHTGKRKTVRVIGIDVARARVSLRLACAVTLPSAVHWIASGAMFALLGACQPITTEIDLRVILPADASDLEATNNVTIVLSPDGFTQTLGTIGVDFIFNADLEPDDTVRRLSLFLARNETLLAWGRTPGFTMDAASRGASVFVGRPGQLSTFPLGFAIDDPGLLAAHARGRGLVALGADGSTTFIDALTLDVSRAATLVASGRPAPDDGAFVGDALGGVQRLGWSEGIRSYRFDPGDNAWLERSLAGAGAVGSREGAAHLVDTPGELLFLYGGGGHTDVVAVSLLPSSGGPAVERVDGVVLDSPRRGATASALIRDDVGLETAVLFGSEDPARPVIYLVEHGQALGPEAAWLGGRCVQLDRGGASATLHVLCAGGMREGEPTADALLLTVPPKSAEDSPSTQLLPDLLLSPMSDPWWLTDDDAVYAQGGGRLLRIERADLDVSEVQEVDRWRAGSPVQLPSGATFLVGGVDADDKPVSRWQVFMPTP
jgi:uncharacterized protein